MKINTVKVSNFGSYGHLEFDYSNTGLALIQGDTGAGKSTLLDIPNWILFGVTAKGMAADQVRSWSTDDPTTGRITLLDALGCPITVERTRGSTNDLFFITNSSQPIRGKDVKETQKLLEQTLGLDEDSYSQACYFHESSISAGFFTEKASRRRELLERLVDLSFPLGIELRAKLRLRDIKPELSRLESGVANSSGRLLQLMDSIKATNTASKTWERVKEQSLRLFEENRAKELARLRKDFDEFEDDRVRQVEELTAVIEKAEKPNNCPTCGNLTGDPKYNTYTALLPKVSRMPNPYEKQLVYVKKQLPPDTSQNPYGAQLEAYTEQMVVLKGSTRAQEKELKDLKHEQLSLGQLGDLCGQMKGLLLQRTVKSIQEQTNLNLEKYFDSELRVKFDMDGGDTLEVDITKDGHQAAYKQLSKGQRALLKLCFGVSVMDAAANKVGQHFDVLLFDEALDGLSPGLKIKAFGLFESLSNKHSSVIMVDHMTEFKNLFERQYQVTLQGDCSVVEEVNG